jgi:L-fucose mutarotase/ribose pyranase (RbsD/FucU family)
MFHEISPEKSLELFRILGDMGFGREIIGVFKKDGME